MSRRTTFLIGILLVCTPLTARAQAAISEVLWMGSDLSTADEWLEVARVPCSGSDCPAVDAGGWTITYLNSSGNEVTMVTFATGTLLSADRPLVIANAGAAQSRLESEPDIISPAVVLPNTKLLLKLKDSAGTVIDLVDDGVGAPFAGANPSGGTKASMERIDLALPGNVKEHWRTATQSLGLDAGAAMFATPGFVESAPPQASSSASNSGTVLTGTGGVDSDAECNTIQCSTTVTQSQTGAVSGTSSVVSDARVILHAVLPNPTGKDELVEWIELKNLSLAPVDLTGWMLLGEGTTAKAVSLNGKSIAGGSTLMLTAAEIQLSLTNTRFSLSLIDPAGTEVSSVSWQSAAEQRLYRPNLYTELHLHVTVSRVIDGDTIEVVFDSEPAPDGRALAVVRLIGIDAPESVHPTRKPEAYGLESAQFLRGLLEKKKIELQFDTENWDVYDRLLAYPLVDEQILAQERLLSSGLARVYPDYPFARRGLFEDYQAHAKALKIGIWSVGSSTSEYRVAVNGVASALSPSPAEAESGAVLESLKDYGLQKFNPAWAEMHLSEVYAHVLTVDKHIPIADHERRIRTLLLGEEWLEVQNRGDQTLGLKGWKIRIGEGSKMKEYAIQHAGSMPSDGMIVLEGSSQKFKLRDEGNTVALVAPDGTVVSSATYPKLKAGQSWVSDDGSGCISDDPTPGKPNRCVSGRRSNSAPVNTPKIASIAKKLSQKKRAKSPSADFLLAQDTIHSLQSRGGGGSVAFAEHRSGGMFWQAATFFIAVIAVCQGALFGFAAWKSGLLNGGVKIAIRKME